MHRKYRGIVVVLLLFVAAFSGLTTQPAHADKTEPGWDFEDHGYLHWAFTGLTSDQIVSELQNQNAAFQAHGLPIPEHVAYPDGAFDQRVIDVVSQYRISGRTAGDGVTFPDTYPVQDWFRMSSATFSQAIDWATIQGWIDSAIAKKGLLNLFTHQVINNPPEYSCTPAMLEQILDYLVARQNAGQLSVMTIRQAYASFNGSKAVVVVAFDDGWKSVYTTAWPMFQTRGLKGTAYINRSPENENDPNYDPNFITWDMISKMTGRAPPNKPTNPNPPNRSNNVSTSVTLSVNVTDPNGDPMNVSFFQQGTESFTIVALPDTQYYSASYPWIFDNQTQWIVNNAESMNIVFVTHEGDIVDSDVVTQWQYANNSVSKLDNQVPYGLALGNHDGVFGGNFVNYNTYFGYSRYTGKSWYGGAYQNNNTNSYQLFSGVNDNYLIFHFEYAPSDAILAWANSTIASYPNTKVIVTTHSYLANDGSRTPEGVQIWNKFVKPHADQISLVLCGHYPGVARRTDIVNGHKVHQVLADYQWYSGYQSGLLRTLKFIPAQDTIFVKTYSPFTNTYLNDSSNEFTLDYDMTGAPTLIGTASNIPSGEVASVMWSGLNYSTTYQWYTVATDTSNASQRSDVWSFSTVPPPRGWLVTITSNPSNGGTTTPSGLQNVTSGTLNVTAYPAAGYTFSHWVFDGANMTANPLTLPQQDDGTNHTLTAHFIQLEYSLTVTVSPEGSGFVSLNNSGPYHYGDLVQLTASPTVGWVFSSWSGDLSGNTSPEVIIMDGNKTGIATFSQTEYTLNITVFPVDSGSVVLNDTGPYHYGDVVELTVTPAIGYSFSFWSDDLSGSTNPSVIIIDGNKVVTANFIRLQCTLTVTASPIGGGLVSRNSSEPYYYGDKVQLLASPSVGWKFTGWTGDIVSTDNPFVITIDGNKTITASFTQETYSLTLTVSPIGSGSLNLNNTGPYHYDDWVELTVVPNAGWKFSTWSGDLSGTTNPTSIYIDGNKTVSANFIQLEYTLTVTISPASGGSVNLNVTAPYHYGDKVELTAVPTTGWAFFNWTGDLSGSANPAAITMDGNKTVTATFAQLQYTLTVTVSPSDGGSVTLNNTGPYYYGDNVQLTAIPTTGWAFSGWSGGLTGSINPVVITIDGNMTVTASFTYHDIAVIGVVPSYFLVYNGNRLDINVTVKNKGINSESFNVTLFCNTTSIATQTVNNLMPNSTATLTFAWNTSSYPYGYYITSAYAWTVPGEINTFDNTKTGGVVTLTISGDVNGDLEVDASDLSVMSEAYGSVPSAPNWNPNCDINGDNKADITDLFAIGKNYQTVLGNMQTISHHEDSLKAILPPLVASPVSSFIFSKTNPFKKRSRPTKIVSKKEDGVFPLNSSEAQVGSRQLED